MGLNATHYLLVGGGSYVESAKRATGFFEKNFLVRYDMVEVVGSQSISAERDSFWQVIEEKISENRKAVSGLVRELRESGFVEIADLNRMGQGYESKVLHIITHLIDGFFGGDTVFYNLEEDSHWLGDSMAVKIKEQPEKFWLLRVECSNSASTDRLNQIRRFEVKPQS